MEGDELYTVKNNFWLGNFSDAIAEAKALRLRTDAARIERDCFVYRSLIGLRKYKQVMDDISDAPSTPTSLASIRIFAAYSHAAASPAAGSARSAAVSSMSELVAGMSDDPALATARVVAATLFMCESKHEDALKALYSHAATRTHTVETLAMTAQVHMRLDRLDLAEAAVKALQALDDESTLTLLSSAWLSVALGGDKYKDAALTFRDIMDRFGPSVPALNGQGVAFLALRRVEDAEKAFAAAAERAKAGGAADVDALINLMALYQSTGRAADAAKLLPTLQETAPEHPYVKSYELARGAFERVAATFGV